MEEKTRRKLRDGILEAAEQTDSSDGPYEAIDRIIYQLEQEFDEKIVSGNPVVEAKTGE